LTFRRCGGGWCHLLWFLLFSMCYSLHVAVNVCINCSFLHLSNRYRYLTVQNQRIDWIRVSQLWCQVNYCFAVYTLQSRAGCRLRISFCCSCSISAKFTSYCWPQHVYKHSILPAIIACPKNCVPRCCSTLNSPRLMRHWIHRHLPVEFYLVVYMYIYRTSAFIGSLTVLAQLYAYGIRRAIEYAQMYSIQ